MHLFTRLFVNPVIHGNNYARPRFPRQRQQTIADTIKDDPITFMWRVGAYLSVASVIFAVLVRVVSS